jgi:glycerol dehydrogenase-like iron-containing ADH family enzyme
MEQFPTIIGRGLISELANIVPRPCTVVAAADVMSFAGTLLGDAADRVIEPDLERSHLHELAQELKGTGSIVGLGGGQAIDTAKYLSWCLQIPVFLAPTALSVNAAWGHRSAVRTDGIVAYRGWTVPEAVFIDLEVIQSAPPLLNWSGSADVLCYHTALWDWKFASEQGRGEPKWPFDERLAEESRVALNRVIDAAAEIHNVSDVGVEALVQSLRYGGGAFAYSGWNPRHIEGADHFIFYALEYVTGKSFIHGQAVSLGILIASALQKNEPDRIRKVIDTIGIQYTPKNLGVSWDDVRSALDQMESVIEKAGLWYTIASARQPSRRVVQALEEWIETPGGHWVDPEA